MSQVHLYEVCLRDGLQNETAVLPTPFKLALAQRLVDAGFVDIEVTSFVRPRWVPQLADATDVIRGLPHAPGVRFWALVPNMRGLERAVEADVGHVATFLSASETHNRKNVNRTVKESLSGLGKVVESAKGDGMGVRSYISTAFGCPFEGEVDVERVLSLALSLRDAGADTIALGDTTGMGHPEQVKRMLERFTEAGIPLEDIALHFHDTRGTAVANAYAAWQFGARRFDGSVSGVGGCPYAPGAAGNACTQDLVHLFERLDGAQEVPEGFAPVTGVDLERVAEAGLMLEGALERPLSGRYHEFWKGDRERQARTA
ncbi:MAG: hydroxymethylglutaryl-CoA lyase [Myxococcales bacterium]|nr:hydroxymethylglutaryl-CoA lyase [Myxococcales bacterium]